MRLTKPAHIFLILVTLFAILGITNIVKANTVIYHNPNSPGVLNANLLYNLVGHFDNDVSLADVSGYQAGDLDNNTHSIYMCTGNDTTLLDTFLADVGTDLHSIFWIGCNFGQLTQYLGGPGPFGFQYDSWTTDNQKSSIHYKNRLISRSFEDLSYFLVQVTGAVQILAELTSVEHPDDRVPYCLRGGNLFFLADNPLYFIGQDDRHLVLTDLLHEFYGTHAPEEKYAMVRLEDLAPSNVMSDHLQFIAEWFFERDIPFSFSVIPIFKDPLGIFHGGVNFEARLEDDPEFVSTMKFLLEHGGTMIMHGVTHQHGDQITGNGWEFVNDETRLPLPEDSEEWVRNRILWGLDEFEKVGFRPRIWETPHYVASHGTYQIVAEFFQSQYERLQVYDLAPDTAPHWGYQGRTTSQLMPFYVKQNIYGMHHLPESIGYLSRNETGHSPQDLLALTDHFSILRDTVPSFYYHHNYVESNKLFEVVEGLLDRGYTFVGPAHFVDHRTDSWLDDDDDTGDDDGNTNDDDDSHNNDASSDDDDDDAGDENDGCGL